MSQNGLRTIAIAYRDLSKINDDKSSSESIYTSEMILVALIGIEDPVRPEVSKAIQSCKSAGITVRMVTGDNILTAKSIAIKCGILNPSDKSDLLLDSRKFNLLIRNKEGKVEQRLFDRVWPRLRVLARSTPQDKYTLVNGIIGSKINKNREVVAVTGDGTNDAPALKRADVGFAMGISGTDVAKEASDIVITDDNFSSIVRAVLWGRNVYDSISKFIQFQLTVNIVAIVTSVITSAAYGVSVLRPIQLLWVNLIMDSGASLALATDEPTDDLLKRPPYGRDKRIISSDMTYFMIFHGIYQIIIIIILIFLAPRMFNITNGFDLFLENRRSQRQNQDAENIPPTQHLTLIFNTFVFLQIFNLLNARKVHGERNIFDNIHRNYLFLIIIIACAIIQVLIVEFTGEFFRVTPLNLLQWVCCLSFGISELVYHQLILFIPKIRIPKKFRDAGYIPSDEFADIDLETPARIMWARGLRRLQQQIAVVTAFRQAIDARSSLLPCKPSPFGEEYEINETYKYSITDEPYRHMMNIPSISMSLIDENDIQTHETTMKDDKLLIQVDHPEKSSTNEDEESESEHEIP